MIEENKNAAQTDTTPSRETKPNPGSPAAIEAGCKCAVLENGHGRRSDGYFSISAECPLHNEAFAEMQDAAEAAYEKAQMGSGWK